MTTDALRFSNYDIVFQEVPGEVTLAINITGCPHRCSGCHSDYLWEYFGELLLKNLDDMISEYDGMITCVCFMGGDQNMGELAEALRLVKSKGLKTCVYSGSDNADDFRGIVNDLDFLKVGPYIEKFGGLDSPTTSQRFFEVVQGNLVNQTHLFRKH